MPSRAPPASRSPCTGEQAVLDYLARYVFRVALTNARIVGLDDQTVTIQYKERKTGRPRTCRLSGDEFMCRFLQHVLPRGFHKVRYFGLWHPAQRHNATRVRQMLQLRGPPEPGPPPELVLPSREYLTRSQCHRSSRGFVRTVIRGGWSSSARSARTRRNRPWRPDRCGCLRRHRPVLPLRASERHRRPLSPTHPTAQPCSR